MSSSFITGAIIVIILALFLYASKIERNADTTAQTDAEDEESHSLEWRNRYLKSRLIYLNKKIDKKLHGKDRGFPNIISPSHSEQTDPERMNQILTEN